MRQTIFFLACFLFLAGEGRGQSVGIGTPTPNAASVLDMGPSAKPMILPRLTTDQMLEVTPPSQGMIVYNTTEHQLYGYMRYRSLTFPIGSVNKWQPISTGPRMLAWGVLDSFATEISGSGTYNVTWDASNRWYLMSFTSPHEYYKDSMLVIITAVGNGSWDQAISTGELIDGTDRYVTIKFTDVSRIAAQMSLLECRRRSGFHFVAYDLRKSPPY